MTTTEEVTPRATFYGSAQANAGNSPPTYPIAQNVFGWDTYPAGTSVLNAMGRSTGAYGQFANDGYQVNPDVYYRPQLINFVSSFPRGAFVGVWARVSLWRDVRTGTWTKDPPMTFRLIRNEPSKPNYGKQLANGGVQNSFIPAQQWTAYDAPIQGPKVDDSMLSVDASGVLCDQNYERLSLEMWTDYQALTNSSLERKWALSNLTLGIDSYYYPPTAYANGPTGVLTTNRPTILWDYQSGAHAASWVPGPTLWCDSYQVRIIAESVASAGGFNPETAPAAYDSGQRPYTAGDPTSFTLPVSLEAGAWRAYVRVWQGNSQGWRLQPSTNWPNTKFTINTAAPPRDPPTIPANVVGALNAAQRARLTNAHVPTFQASLFWWDGSATWPLNLLDGSVTLESRAKLRGRASFTVTNHDLVPSAPAPIDFAKPLHPYGSYVVLARGVAGALVSLGVFRIEAVKVEDKGQGAPVVAIEAQDYEAHLIDARFMQGTSRQSWATGTAVPNLVTDVAKAIISEGGCAFRVPTASSAQVAANYVNERGDDRVDALKSLAASLGWVTYLTYDGAVYFGPPTARTAPPKADLVEGENAIVVSKSFVLARSDVFDVGAVVNDDANVSGYAYDANPLSPINRSGVNPSIPTFGAGSFAPAGKPFFLASPVVTTQAAANAAAITVLQTNALPADRVVVNCVCVPDLRPQDVVTLRRIGADNAEQWWVESVTIPLDVKSAQQLVIVGPPAYVQGVN